MEIIEYIIAALFFAVIALWVYVPYQLRKLKNSTALELSDIKADLNDRINRKNEDSLESIEKLRSETPLLSIKNNEAYLHTRDVREIHRYQLTKRK